MNSLRTFLISLFIALVIFIPIALYLKDVLITNTVPVFLGVSVEEEVETEVTEETVSTEESAPPVQVIEDEIKGESFNLLLVGTDFYPSMLDGYHPDILKHEPEFGNSKALIGYEGRLPEYPFRRVNADAIVLICFNKETQTIAYLSIPSNMQLNVGGATTTLGELYYDKGFEYFKNKISGITGVPIDYYVLVSMEDMATRFDALTSVVGDINFDVPCDMNYVDDTSGFTISLTAGKQQITGEKAVAMLAYNYADSAYTREKVTVDFLKTVAIKALMVLNTPKRSQMFDAVTKEVNGRALCTNIDDEFIKDNYDMIFKYGNFNIVQVEYAGVTVKSGDKTLFQPYVDHTISLMQKYK